MSQFPLLAKINTPEDLRRLDVKQLPQVCDELRGFIIEQLAKHPGHLASSLGTVELTVALHYVFNTPEDRLVWDVGHQAYGHKILTGRRERFHTNRQLGGLRPFPFPTESPYDTFACGHASNSISAALGMATAVGSERKVVAIIGDGAMSGGLAYEGLNNASETPNNLLIILNDNEMSIDPAVGGFRNYLHHLHTSSFYNRLRYRTSKFLSNHGMLSDKGRTRILRFNNSVKSFLQGRQNIFEGMNIRYFGPNDGHDVVELVRTLRCIKEMEGPKLLHINTVKGKGYSEAEKDPTVWHAPGKFDPETGKRAGSAVPKNEQGAEVSLPVEGEATQRAVKEVKFQQVFGETIVELAHQNPDIIGITPAMPTGCSLCIMMQEMPDRCYDVGIAEGHSVTFAAGLAREGKLPFCNIYSSFAQRAYDNIIHDTALQQLPVVICLDRAGLVGDDGSTHHGVFDLACLRPIPNLTICAPMDEHELRDMMFTAQLPGKGAVVIRYPRGASVHPDWQSEMKELPVGKGRILQEKEGSATAILSLGHIGNSALAAAEILRDEHKKEVDIYDMRFLKPLDYELIDHVVAHHSHIITLEDGVKSGGFGSAVLQYIEEKHSEKNVKVTILGIPDRFIPHGSIQQLQKECGIDIPAIVASALD